MTKHAAAATAQGRRGRNVGLCLIECTKVKHQKIREACYKKCFERHLSNVFEAIQQVVAETGLSHAGLFESLRAEFEIQYQKAENMQLGRAAVQAGTQETIA